MNKVFSGVSGNTPKLNRFDLSYTNIFSADIGVLYPVQCDEVVPGDYFKTGFYAHAEVMPLRAPLMSDLQMYVHQFFVPYRLLYGVNSDGENIWEKYITGGKDGNYATPLPAWRPSFSIEGFTSRTIWDSIGNPVNSDSSSISDEHPFPVWTPLVPPRNNASQGQPLNGLDVSIAPKYAYNFIYNSYYRDENLVDEIDKDSEVLQSVSFRKDYFTSALLWQQRGTAPALPIESQLSGMVPVLFKPQTTDGVLHFNGSSGNGISVYPIQSSSDRWNFIGYINDTYSSPDSKIYAQADLSHGTGKVVSTSFTIPDLRLTTAVQRVQELSMRSGYRYTEFLSAEFGVSPTDARLDRPEYIGGAVVPVSVVSSVQTAQTSDTSEGSVSPQGNKVGVGSLDSVMKLGKYRVLEYGLIMTLVSFRPKPIYKQGINRQWLRQNRFDYYLPEFAWLSEQEIYSAENYVDGTSDDAGIFGFQAHFNEMRCKNNIVSGAVRTTYDYWTMAREFGSRPHLNEDFITINSDDFSNPFAVQNEDKFIVSFTNLLDSYRPLPAYGTPGLVDHSYGGHYV